MGRGVFHEGFGLLPHRRRVLTVIGKPVQVSQTLSPSKQELDEVHAQYVNALKSLYNAYRREYDPQDARELIIN